MFLKCRMDVLHYPLHWCNVLPTDKQNERGLKMGIMDKFMDAWTEYRPAPLNMSDREILDWLEEIRPAIEWKFSSVSVFIPEIGKTFGKNLNEAVCLAAAKWKEANE